jgi:lipopolysaccharide export system permease protein
MAGALVIVASIIFLVDYMEISKSLENSTKASGLDILVLLLLKAPNAILILLPFAFLFGSQFAFVSLNRRSELIAMRAAGVSAWRFILPASTMAFVFGILTIGALNPITSWMKHIYDNHLLTLETSRPITSDKAIYLRQGDGKRQVVVRADSRISGTGVLNNVSFWVYAIDEKGIPEFWERVDAGTATLKPGVWELKNVYKSAPGESVLFYDNITIDSNLDPKTAFKSYNNTQSVPFWQLPALIARSESSGFSSNAYSMKLFELLATPLMYAAMTALGAVFSLRLMRLGGITQQVISGLGLGFAIFFINQLFNSMGKAEVIPTYLAAWSPPILALTVAMVLLVYTEDG